MRQVNIHEATTYLSTLIREALGGEPFIIARLGKPQAVVYPCQSPSDIAKRTGFIPDIEIPNDFDLLNRDEITNLFSGSAI